MDDKFDKKLRAMAKNSKIKESDSIKNLTRTVIANQKRKRYKRQLAVASIFIVCTLSFGGFLDVFANDSQAINSVLEFFSNSKNKIDDGYKDNTSNHNYSVNSEEYSVVIEDTYYDGEKLELFYKITNNNGLDKSKIYYLNTNLSVNADIDAIGGLERKEFINDNTFVGMISYRIVANSSETWPEVLEGFININEIIVYGKDDEVTIPMNVDSLQINLDSKNVPIEEFSINSVVSFEGLKSEFTKAIKTPTGIIIEEIRDSSWRADTGYYFHTLVWDSEKGILGFKNKTAEDFDGNVILKQEYEKPSKGSTVSIINFALNSGSIGDGSDRVQTYNLEESTTLNLDDLGEITVEKIEYKEDETLLTMRLKGYMASEDLDIKNGDSRIRPISIVNKEVLGQLDMRLTYVYPKTNKDLGLNACIYIPKYLNMLEDQIINIQF